MATTTIVNTSNMAFYLGADGSETKISNSTDASISITHAPRETTNKSSGGWRYLLEGLRSASGSASFFFVGSEGSAYTLHDFYTQCITNRQTIHAIFKTDDAADLSFEGDIFLSSIEISSGGVEDSVTVSISFDFTGPIEVVNT